MNNEERIGNHQHHSTILSAAHCTDTDLPGNVHIRVLFLVPTTGLESAAKGVCFSPVTGREE